MTFIGVGDIIAILDLTWKVCNACKESSENFHALGRDVEAVSSILQLTQETIKHNSFTEVYNATNQRRLESLIANCNSVLNDIESLLEKYEGLNSPARFAYGWSRLMLAFDRDATDLRRRMKEEADQLNNFNTALMIAGQIVVCEILTTWSEEKGHGAGIVRGRKSLTSIKTKGHGARRCSTRSHTSPDSSCSVGSASTVSSSSTTLPTSWEEIKRALPAAFPGIGITENVLEAHKELIRLWLEQLASGSKPHHLSSIPNFSQALQDHDPEEHRRRILRLSFYAPADMDGRLFDGEVPEIHTEPGVHIQASLAQKKHENETRQLIKQMEILLGFVYEDEENTCMLKYFLSRPEFQEHVDLATLKIYDGSSSRWSTVLHQAARKGCFAAVDLLIFYGADPLQRDYWNRLALMVTEDEEIKSLLESAASPSSTPSRTEYEGHLEYTTGRKAVYEEMWFELRDGFLRRYRSPVGKHRTSLKMESVSLQRCSNPRLLELVSQECPNDKFSVLLRADNREEAQLWYCALMSSIRHAKNTVRQGNEAFTYSSDRSSPS